MFDEPRSQQYAGAVFAVIGVLTTIPYINSGDVTGIGWGITIAICGLIIRSHAQTLELNQATLEANEYLIQQNQLLRERLDD